MGLRDCKIRGGLEGQAQEESTKGLPVGPLLEVWS